MFGKSQLQHKSVHFFFILVMIKDKLTNLCGNWLLSLKASGCSGEDTTLVCTDPCWCAWVQNGLNGSGMVCRPMPANADQCRPMLTPHEVQGQGSTEINSKAVCGTHLVTLLPRFFWEKIFFLKLSGNAVCYTAWSSLVIVKNSCSRPHCEQ